MNIGGMRIRTKEYFGLERRVVANKTTESWDNVPHAGILFDYDVTGIFELVSRLKESPEFAKTRVTLNTVILKIVAEGLKRSPAMNAHIAYNRRTSVGIATHFESINIAIPFVTKDRRTITPVVRDMERKSLFELCLAVEDLKRRVANTDVEVLLRKAAWRDAFIRLRKLDMTLIPRFLGNVVGPGRLPLPSRERTRAFEALTEADRIEADDLLSATFLVSNIGSVLPDFRVYPHILEVIPPQASALCFGAAGKQAVVVEGPSGEDRIAVRTTVPVSLMIDHRLLDFEHVVEFLKTLKEYSETPEKVLE